MMLNRALLSRWQNWITILLMVLLGMFATHIFFTFIDDK